MAESLSGAADRRTRRCRALLRWLAALVVLGIVSIVIAFFQAGHFLEAPAQPPAKADLIASLGGDNGARAFRVRQLYRQGFAAKVLLAGPEGFYSRTRSHHQNWRARYLMDQGIPEQALLYDREAASSWDEAVNTLRLMQAMKLDRVLVVSDPPHLRRLSWVWGKVFEGSGKSYTLVASDMETWDPAYWWRTSQNAQFVFAEYIKLAYYLFEY